tara:strand:- start:868 stop:1488 length:621 start_codon:yes stop_codon:yes gene_type:complete
MKPSYYAIIPANVRYSNLKPHAKLLYGEITALASKEGYCFATNRYFSELYEVTKNTVSSWISDLQKEGFVSVQLIKEGNQVIERRIGITRKGDTPITFKQEDNSTSNNITINNLSKRIDEFDEEVHFLENNSEICKEFIIYWSELNKSKTKMRWELERTWDLRARIDRWKARKKEWTKATPKKNTLKNKLDTFTKAKQMMNQINAK